jgi:pimeloyl-ACP methyl ester carboxylesterase
MIDGWELYEHGPSDARHTVLLVPGGLCSASFFDEVIAEPTLNTVRLVATTLPGHAGTPPPDDLSVETCANQAGKLAADLGADVVVGHSMGANVAIEMVAAKAFSGPVVVISPSFSREDESKVLRVLDRLTTAFGHLPYALMLKLIGSALKGEVPDDRAAALTAEFQKNDPRVVRRGIRLYLQYLDRHGSVAPRLCDSGVMAWVAFGEKNDVGLTDNERAELDSCPHVTLVTVADASHFILATHPGRVAELILEAISSAA